MYGIFYLGHPVYALSLLALGIPLERRATSVKLKQIAKTHGVHKMKFNEILEWRKLHLQKIYKCKMINSISLYYRSNSLLVKQKLVEIHRFVLIRVCFVLYCGRICVRSSSSAKYSSFELTKTILCAFLLKTAAVYPIPVRLY